MRDEARSRRDALRLQITINEARSRLCAEMAYMAEQEDNQDLAGVVRFIGRSHTVSALELAGELAVLQERHGHLLDGE